MPKYEYAYRRIPSSSPVTAANGAPNPTEQHTKDVERVLNDLGIDGFEVIEVTDVWTPRKAPSSGATWDGSNVHWVKIVARREKAGR